MTANYKVTIHLRGCAEIRIESETPIPTAQIKDLITHYSGYKAIYFDANELSIQLIYPS